MSHIEVLQSADQALEVLLSLGEHGPETVSGLARRLDRNRTVVHRLVATLEQRGFVRRHEDATIALGPALLALGSRIAPELRAVARPHLLHLAHVTGETAVLSVPDGDGVVALDQVPGERHTVQVRYRPGTRHPQTHAAHGRALLAAAHEDRATALLDDATSETVERVNRAREDGYATSHDELQSGAAGVAAPIRDDEGRAVASIGIVAPVSRLGRPDALAGPVLAAAAAVEDDLSETVTVRLAG